jgi:uncharacterized protein YbaP (TraB family)
MTSLFPALNRSITAIYLFLFAYLGTETALIAANSAGVAAPHSFLWKIEGPHPSWLCGTVHSGDPRVAILAPNVIAALAASHSFHPEIELSPETIMSLAAKLFPVDAPDLAPRLPPGLWARLVRAGAQLGLPEPMLHQLSPGTAALLFSAPEEGDAAATVDGQLYARAREQNLRIAALETIEEQLAVFQQLPDAQAIAALTEALDEVDAGRPDDRKLLDAYAAGDDRAILDAVQADFARSPASRALANPLLYDRNRVMAQRLVPYLAPGGAFVAIGVAHLIGPRSVIELLRARGYKITRVP